MKKILFVAAICVSLLAFKNSAEPEAWVRINLLGYKPSGVKVAVWCSKGGTVITDFTIVDVLSGKTVYTSKQVKKFGAYGPFSNTSRLNFTDFNQPGRYVIVAGGVSSPEFTISRDVYKGAADFALRYMRQ
ncbi:MAG: cellulase, partial [Chitinophagaceae bacterium]